MKKTLLKKACVWVLSALVTTSVLSSCSKEKDEPATLTVTPTSIDVTTDGGVKSINIKSNTKWVISMSCDWISVPTKSGSGDATVDVTVQPNSGFDDRSSVLSIMTSDGNIETEVSVTQKAKQIILSTDVSSIYLPAKSGESRTLRITANSEWIISGVPDWLMASSTSGNGDTSIVLTARSENESSKERVANIMISSGSLSVIVTITQEAGLSTCKVTPSNITSLYYGVAFDLVYASNVSTAKILLISDYDMKHKSENEIIKAVEAEDSQIPEDQTVYSRAVDEDCLYHILALAYDNKGNRGELTDVTFTSPKYYNGTDDAWCLFSEVGCTSDLFFFTVEKQGRCTSYNLIYGTNIYTRYLTNNLLMAFEINYYATNHKKHWFAESWELEIELNYPNNHMFIKGYGSPAIYNYGGAFAAAWGIFSDGKLSSDLNMVGYDLFDTGDESYSARKTADMYRNLNGWLNFSRSDKRYCR